jgi:uncharacterized membrane-anchored protein
MKKFSCFLLLLATVAIACAQDDSTAAVDDAISHHADSILQTFNFQSGTIPVGTVAEVTVPPGFKYLSAHDAQTVLTSFWNNPPDADVLGMLVPEDVDFFDPSSWAITYSYDEDGHVNDDDAKSINYTDLLKEMQDATIEANKERVKEGYSSIALTGWAQEPYYDKTSHKMHWAKKLKVDNDTAATLNYNIRMLGRKGVLVMNVIAGMDNFSTVKSNMNTLLTSTNFTSGNRYGDFNDKIDKVAEYGIGGLVAGAVLVKTGLLAKLGLILVKAWKVIVLAVAGAGAAIKKFFSKKKETGGSEIS